MRSRKNADPISASTQDNPSERSLPASVTDIGLWIDAPPVRRQAPVPALFLDRDGVIVEEVGHLRRPADVRLIPDAGRVIAAANRAGVPVVVVSNQSGIGRGLFDWDDFGHVQDEIAARLAEDGARLDAVLACAFHGRAFAPFDRADHPCRKPNPGLLLIAAERLGLDLARSWIIGDRSTDLAAGQAAGLAGGLLVTTGHGGEPNEWADVAALAAGGILEVAHVNSIGDALNRLPLFGHGGRR
jgi:D-glycero-D-manno-heptose 1,7-bisphosphate phosphatase